MSIILEELKGLVAFAKQNGLKAVKVKDLSFEFFEKEKSPPAIMEPVSFELPKEAQPPTGDALLFWSSEDVPEEEDKPKTGA